MPSSMDSAADILRQKAKDRRTTGKSTLEKLPAQKLAEMLENIKMGCWDYVAAQTVGVTAATFNSWLQRGKDNKSKMYKEFYLSVMEARAQARLLAEATVLNINPLSWLTKGPAKCDWSDRQVVAVEGQLSHQVEGEIAHRLIPQDNIAEAMEFLEQIGYLSSPGDGNGKPLVLNVEPGGNGDE